MASIVTRLNGTPIDTTARVICIGDFAGGSFGVQGHPNKLIRLYAVDCRSYRERRRVGVCGLERWTFGSEAEARAALPAIEHEEFGRAVRERRAELEADQALRSEMAEHVTLAGAGALGCPAGDVEIVSPLNPYRPTPRISVRNRRTGQTAELVAVAR